MSQIPPLPPGHPQNPQYPPQYQQPPQYPPQQPYPPQQGFVPNYGGPGTGGPGCPKCGSTAQIPVKFTWWGGVIGPRMLSHVRCANCRAGYNSKTGKSNDTAILIYSIVAIIIAIAVFGMLYGMRA